MLGAHNYAQKGMNECTCYSKWQATGHNHTFSCIFARERFWRFWSLWKIVNLSRRQTISILIRAPFGRSQMCLVMNFSRKVKLRISKSAQKTDSFGVLVAYKLSFCIIFVKLHFWSLPPGIFFFCLMKLTWKSGALYRDLKLFSSNMKPNSEWWMKWNKGPMQPNLCSKTVKSSDVLDFLHFQFFLEA